APRQAAEKKPPQRQAKTTSGSKKRGWARALKASPAAMRNKAREAQSDGSRSAANRAGRPPRPRPGSTEWAGAARSLCRARGARRDAGAAPAEKNWGVGAIPPRSTLRQSIRAKEQAPRRMGREKLSARGPACLGGFYSAG